MEGIVTVDRLVDVYIKLRDRRAARTSAYEKEDRTDKDKMELIEAELLSRAEQAGVTGFKTEEGTTYVDLEYQCSGADWGAFYTWMKDNDAMDMLQRRIKSTSIKQYMEEHEGATPPGVNVVIARKMKIRRT